MEAGPLGRLAFGLSALAAIVWAFVGHGRSLRVDPADRLPRSPRIGTGLRRPVAWLAGITLVGAGLRLYALGGELWTDEILTVTHHLDRPVHELVLWPTSRNVHLLYALLMKVTTGIWGVTGWTVRLPAAAFGIATIPAVYVLGRTFLRGREAMLAAALLAVSYHHVWFSQNARGHSALLLFTALSTTFLIRALRDDRVRDWILYGGTALLGVATSLLGGLVLVGHALALPFLASRLRACGVRVGPLLGKTSLAIGVTGLAALDLYGTGLPALLRRAETERPEAGAVGTLDIFWSDLWAGLSEGLGVAGLATLVVLGIPVLLGAFRVTRRHPVVVVLLLAPLAATGIAFQATGLHMFPRYFLWALPVFAVGVVGSLAMLAPSARWLPASFVALLVAVSIAALPRVYRVPKQPTRSSLAWTLERSGPDDLVVSYGVTTPGVKFYLPRLETAPSRPVGKATSVEELEAIENRYPDRRVWLLTTGHIYSPSVDTLLLDHLAGRYRRAKAFPATIERMETLVWTAP